MHGSNRKGVVTGLVAGAAVTILAAVMMGQGASQPVKTETQYFVTGEHDEAHLWVREGTNLRCIGHGECKAHQHDHKEGDGHDHGKETPKK